MRPQIQSQPGIILKKIAYGEADEIITVLLKHDGIRRFFVPSSRKSKKRFQGLIDNFSHLNFFYKPSDKSLWHVQGVEEVGDSLNTWKSLQHFAFGSFLAELICEFTPEGDSDHGIYNLWVEMVQVISDQCSVVRQNAGQKLTTVHCLLSTYSHYLIKLFEHTGYALELTQCVNCGEKKLPDRVLLDYLRGGLMCQDCEPSTLDSNISKFPKTIFTMFDHSNSTVDINEEQGIQLLQQLTQFSHNIMQKQSRAANFFINSLIKTL